MTDTFHIHQIMPCTIPMQAVFYDFSDEEVVRQDVLCLAVIHFTPSPDSKFSPCSIVRCMVGDKDGRIYDPSWMIGFLGVEFSGVMVNWDEKVREIIEQSKKVNVRKAMN